MEMESLLVHSDGERAVVLVIDADHSSLGKQKGWGGGQTGSQTVRHVILYFPFPPSCPPHVPAALTGYLF